MKEQFKAFRFLVSALAISAALSLVCFAQQTSGNQGNRVQVPKEISADKVAALVAEWTRAKDYTKEYLDAMPEDGIGFKPSPDIRSFGNQMVHLAGGFYFMTKPIFGIDAPYDPRKMEEMPELKKDKAALTKTVMDSYDLVIAQIKKLDAAKLDESITLFGIKMPRHIAIAKAFEHQTHHRGQTTIYLRLKGVKPPPEKLF